MPDVFLVGYTEERAKGSKKIEVQSKKGQNKVKSRKTYWLSGKQAVSLYCPPP